MSTPVTSYPILASGIVFLPFPQPKSRKLFGENSPKLPRRNFTECDSVPLKDEAIFCLWYSSSQRLDLLSMFFPLFLKAVGYRIIKFFCQSQNNVFKAFIRRWLNIIAVDDYKFFEIIGAGKRKKHSDVKNRTNAVFIVPNMDFISHQHFFAVMFANSHSIFIGFLVRVISCRPINIIAIVFKPGNVFSNSILILRPFIFNPKK